MILGIDLGTTYSVAACLTEENGIELIENAEGSRITPSVVLFDDDKIIVGEEAKDAGVISSADVIVAIKNKMGKPEIIKTHKGIEYNPEMISSLIIRKLVKDAEKNTGKKVKSVVVTIPAYFNDAQRKATADAVVLADVKLAGMINEPTAAALYYIKKNNVEKSNILIYDLGGGTFDATLLHVENSDNIEVLSTAGIQNTGGHFFDEMIADYVCDYINEKHEVDLTDEEYQEDFQELLLKAEKIKKNLSAKNKAVLNIKVGKIKEKIEITREWFESESMLGIVYTRTESKIKEVVKDASLTIDDIDIVLMVGGSSRIPYIEKNLFELTGKKPSREVNPDEVVAMGAALFATFKGKESNVKKFVDVCSHSIGVVVRDNGIDENEIIIPRNSRIPVQREVEFRTMVDNQKKLELTITEGDFKELVDVTKIGNLEIDIPQSLPKHSQILVKISLDDYQIINIEVAFPAIGYVKQHELKRIANMDNETLINATGMLRAINVS